MTQLMERKPEVTTVLERPPLRELPAPKRPSPFVRWMGWLAAFVVVAGIGTLIWWGVSEITAGDGAAQTWVELDLNRHSGGLQGLDPATLDRHEAASVLREQARVNPLDEFEAGFSWVQAPLMTNLDPRVNPEISSAWTPAPSAITPDLLGDFEVGFVWVSSPTMGDLDPRVNPEISSAWAPAPVFELLDPHESPEILRTR